MSDLPDDESRPTLHLQPKCCVCDSPELDERVATRATIHQLRAACIYYALSQPPLHLPRDYTQHEPLWVCGLRCAQALHPDAIRCDSSTVNVREAVPRFRQFVRAAGLQAEEVALIRSIRQVASFVSFPRAQVNLSPPSRASSVASSSSAPSIEPSPPSAEHPSSSSILSASAEQNSNLNRSGRDGFKDADTSGLVIVWRPLGDDNLVLLPHSGSLARPAPDIHMYSRDAALLLQHNPWLKQRLFRARDSSSELATSDAAQSSPAGYMIGESGLRMLLLIAQLHFLQREGVIGCHLQITMLSEPTWNIQVNNFVKSANPAIETTPARVAEDWSNIDFWCIDQVDRASEPWQQQSSDAQFTQSSSPGLRIGLRWADKLGDLRHGGRIRLLLAQGSFEYGLTRCAPQAQLNASIDRICSWIYEEQTKALHASAKPRIRCRADADHRVIRWPPIELDKLNHKHHTHAQLHRYMLPACWVSISDDEAASQQVDATSERVAVHMLQSALVQKELNGGRQRFVLKGTYACAKQCVQFVHVEADGSSPELIKAVRSMLVEFHQRALGLQPFIEQFSRSEIRHFCRAVPACLRALKFDENALASPPFSTNFIVRTSWDVMDNTVLHTEQCTIDATDSFATHQLVQSMLHDPSLQSMLQELVDLGLPWIRVDCGFDWQTSRPFFNEFAFPYDACVWTGGHQQDLLWTEAIDTARLLAPLLFCQSSEV